MAAAGPSPTGELEDSTSRHATDEFYGEETDGEGRMDASHMNAMRDKERKIGHRRVDKAGIVSYKKKPTSELMAAIQLGIGQSVGGLSSKPERDVLMQDFGVVEVVFFPGEGSNLTPAHHYSDFRFKTYAPVAFRYFRDLFGIQPEDFMLSLCNEPLKELSNPGASGSIFYLTHDDEFIIKTVQHKEADFLQKLLPGYFLNISQNKRTLLPKFYGLYCYQCGGKNIRFTVMNNLLPSTVQLHEKYDMKGSTYKRKASKSERAKKSPTLKDLDFIEIHPECLQLEKDIYDSLIKTLQRDCRVLESFKIMDYSLLVGIYNLDLLSKESRAMSVTEQEGPLESSGGSQSYGGGGLQRGKSMRTRIGQYSTPLESIQGNTDLRDELEDDEDVPLVIKRKEALEESYKFSGLKRPWTSITIVLHYGPGGIPARNAKGERILLYLGIIDILQSFRLKKRLEHTVKSMVIDGDTISVHRPSYYAQRFLQYHATRVFRKAHTALKHSPSKRRALNKSTKQTPGQSEAPEQQQQHSNIHSNPRSSRTISFSDEQIGTPDEVGGKPPDLLPEYSKSSSTKRSPRLQHDRGNANNVNGTSTHQKRSDAFSLTTYPSEDALSAGTASTASLRAIGVGSGSIGHPTSSGRGASPPLSLSESTPTHTDFTEGTPSFTNSSPSCSSDVMATYNKKAVVTFCTPPPTPPINCSTTSHTHEDPVTINSTSSTESRVSFKLPPSSSSRKDDGDAKDSCCDHEAENMGGGVSPMSPLEGMDSPNMSHHHHHHHRSPDLHHHLRGRGGVHTSGKTISTSSTVRTAMGTTVVEKTGEASTWSADVSPMHHPHADPSPSKQQGTEVTVMVIPESPPPPFEAVVGEESFQPSPPPSSQPVTQIQKQNDDDNSVTTASASSSTSTTVVLKSSQDIVNNVTTTTNTTTAITKNNHGEVKGGGVEVKTPAVPAISNTAGSSMDNTDSAAAATVEEADAAVADEMTRL